MLVRRWMTKRPLTVEANASAADAWRLMGSKRIRHLPVCEQTKLVGILSDRDIRLAFPTPAEDGDVEERR